MLLVSMDEFKHIYASELQLSTRFPFHCQDRLLLTSGTVCLCFELVSVAVGLSAIAVDFLDSLMIVRRSRSSTLDR